MALRQTIAVQEVEVTWTDDGSSSGDWELYPAGTLVFDENLALISYRLSSGSTPGVTFYPEAPLVWDEPSMQPPNIGLILLEGSLLITNLNVATEHSSKSYRFYLQVSYEGRVYRSPDPTIVNTEPPILMAARAPRAAIKAA